MTDSDTAAALARIERALARIEGAAARQPEAAPLQDQSQVADLLESNARLKDGMRAAIADIDRLLATAPEGAR